MCAMCDGQTAGDFMAGVIQDIDRVGWAAIAVEDERGKHKYTYTVGLTRYHAHPELIVSGGASDAAHHLLDTMAEAVRNGRRLTAGEVLGACEAGRQSLVLPVTDPSRLVLAQRVYGSFLPVSALQVVWSDEGGRWPWQMCENHRAGQELYGAPPRG